MKNDAKALEILIVALFVATPAFTAPEAAGMPAMRELTPADFQRSAEKPIVAWGRYRQSKQKHAHDVSRSAWDASRIQTEASEKTRADFLNHGTKPAVASEQFRRYKYRQSHPVKPDPLMRRGDASSGKPVVDWWHTRRARG